MPCQLSNLFEVSMNYDIFIKTVREHLTDYKHTILGVNDCGTYRNKKYGHILPNEYEALNIGLVPSAYKLEGSLLRLNGCPAIKLHMDWRHMNSSQILCIAYFYSFIDDKNKLQKLVTNVLKIDSEVDGAEFEYITPDGSNIDFVVHLKNGGHIFFEIKYTEREFGSATSKTADYTEIKKKFHSNIEISDAHYLKNYQLVRNICLSPKGGNNYTVFLVPKDNGSINYHYEHGTPTIANINKFNVQRLYWEDLIQQIPDNTVFEKYFNYNRK